MPMYNASNTLITEGGCRGGVALMFVCTVGVLFVCVWNTRGGRIYIVRIYFHPLIEKVHYEYWQCFLPGLSFIYKCLCV